MTDHDSPGDGPGMLAAGAARPGRSMRHALMAAGLVLAGCAPAPLEEMPSRAATATDAMPAMKAFPSGHPVPPQRSNRDIARDFLDLTFELESGRELERFSRFEGPITVRVTGSPPPTLTSDLDRLLGRLRREADLDIDRATGRDRDANITIEAVTRAEIRRYLPKAACFVVPNVSGLEEYRRARNSRATSWRELTRRERIAIFVPSDSAPQEVRDCLHEELGQAIGPLNDLYHLPDSVFNDDNVHAVLTGFDMLILRAYYAPELETGMTRQQVAARLPAILSRLNPGGDSVASRRLPPTSRDWIDAIQTALGPGAGPTTRRDAAREALSIARHRGWQDHRLAFSHFALGRLTQSVDPDFALRRFIVADKIYERLPGAELHRAYAASQLAAYVISQGRGAEALRMLAPHLRVAKRHQNAALLATLMMLKAEALALEGRTAEARAVRLDSLGWARYGFGADWAVRAKLHEVTALSPLNDADEEG